MGLPGQHIVETGLARLAAFWPVVHPHAQLPDFNPVYGLPDDDAVAEASAIYNGSRLLDAMTFAELRWLGSFACSGRQLLMCHALRLLEGWNNSKHPAQTLADEATLLDIIAKAVGPFTATLEASLLQPLQKAFAGQLRRVQARRCHTSQDRLAKALSLLGAAKVTRQPAPMIRDAMPLLDHALAQLVASDGGPVAHQLGDYAQWIATLLQASELPYAQGTRNALDRASSFLAMTLGADRKFCFNPETEVVNSIAETSALRLASVSNVARVAAGKAVLIALPGQLTGHASLHLSSHGQALLRASLFLHENHEDQSVTCLTPQSTDQGHLLEQGFAAARRMAFVSPKGDDIRLEDSLPPDGLKRWMSLAFNPDAKISIARAGNHATIALGHRNLWQLNLRGGKLLPLQSDNTLIVEASPSSQPCVRWALKRISRSNNKAEKPETQQLPF